MPPPCSSRTSAHPAARPAAEKKRVIDKHTNLATALLGAIKERQLDAFYSLEEDCLGNKADAAAVARQLQVGRRKGICGARLQGKGSGVCVCVCMCVFGGGDCQWVGGGAGGCFVAGSPAVHGIALPGPFHLPAHPLLPAPSHPSVSPAGSGWLAR